MSDDTIGLIVVLAFFAFCFAVYVAYQMFTDWLEFKREHPND
ncbi:MAG: hypothetical protein WBC18_20445 [Ottowia sp.]